MSSTFSTVSSMVKSGAISTMPPMLETRMMASTKPIAVRSSFLCGSGMSLLPRQKRALCAERLRALARQQRLVPDRHEVVVGTDRSAEEEEVSDADYREVAGVHRDQLSSD